MRMIIGVRRLRKFLFFTLVLTFVLAGCRGEVNRVNEPAAPKDDIEPRAEVTEGDFVYRLVSEKNIYADGEKVELYAELEYVGEEQEIQIAHAASPFYFPMTERIRGLDISYAMDQPRVVTTLKKGEPLREYYKGGGSFTEHDPKEHVDFVKSVFEAIQKGTLPSGEYEVSGRATFEPLNGSDGTEEISIDAEIDFVVGQFNK